MKRTLLGLFTLLALTAAQAQAAEKTVMVDGKARPWDIGVNPKLYYGISGPNGKAPSYVMGIKLRAGAKLKFTATGTTTTFPGNPSIGPGGEKTFVTDSRYGNPGAFFPSRHFDKATYPTYLNQLVGAFVDADGAVVGQPFPIGEQAEVVIPAGALSISLGINDDNLNDNTGKLQVTIDYTTATVTGEEVQ